MRHYKTLQNVIDGAVVTFEDITDRQNPVPSQEK
jgi:hypothetical protein